MYGQEKLFKIKVISGLKNVIFRLASANTILHKRAIFYQAFTQNMQKVC